MIFDDGHQQLKAQLMAVFDRASVLIEETSKKTKDLDTVIEKEEAKGGDSRFFHRINGRAKDEKATNEGDNVLETTQ